MNEKNKTRGDAIDNAVAVLNRIHLADPFILPALIDYRVQCNEVLTADPTVQVSQDGEIWRVGLLGIVNGLFEVGTDGAGFIAAVYDDSGVLTHFIRLEKS